VTLRQEVFWLAWDGEQRAWKSTVDGQNVQGTVNAIVHTISENGWEITTVTPMSWLARYGSKVPGVLDDSLATPRLLAITAKFVECHSAEPAN
jgi:hypothetical protein